MTSQQTPHEIFEVNPYEGHPSLSPIEASALWEYAKLAQHVKMVCIQELDSPSDRGLTEA